MSSLSKLDIQRNPALTSQTQLPSKCANRTFQLPLQLQLSLQAQFIAITLGLLWPKTANFNCITIRMVHASPLLKMSKSLSHSLSFSLRISLVQGFLKPFPSESWNTHNDANLSHMRPQFTHFQGARRQDEMRRSSTRGNVPKKRERERNPCHPLPPMHKTSSEREQFYRTLKTESEPRSAFAIGHPNPANFPAPPRLACNKWSPPPFHRNTAHHRLRA